MAVRERQRINRQFALAEALERGRDRMTSPQDLPGRFGRVVRDLDRVLAASQIEAVLAGGWAVWRHGFTARVTKDIDVAVSRADVAEFLRVAAVTGFQVLDVGVGKWPKLIHCPTAIDVAVLAEGARPGMSGKPAPTLIPHPATMGASGPKLVYIALPSLVELKLAAGRPRDEADVIELIRTNAGKLGDIRTHLGTVHQQYVDELERLRILADDPRV